MELTGLGISIGLFSYMRNNEKWFDEFTWPNECVDFDIKSDK